MPTLNDNGIFARIVRGEIPCHKIFENEHVLAFLDIGPLSRGHCLVIPKKAYVRLEDMDSDTAAAVGAALPRVAAALVKVTGAPGYNVLQNNGRLAGQVVEHVHFHLIPCYENGAGLKFPWGAGKLSDQDAAALRQAMTDALSHGAS